MPSDEMVRKATEAMMRAVIISGRTNVVYERAARIALTAAGVDEMEERLATAEQEAKEWGDAVTCGGFLTEPCRSPDDPCWEHYQRSVEAERDALQQRVDEWQKREGEDHPFVPCDCAIPCTGRFKSACHHKTPPYESICAKDRYQHPEPTPRSPEPALPLGHEFVPCERVDLDCGAYRAFHLMNAFGCHFWDGIAGHNLCGEPPAAHRAAEEGGGE